MNIKDQIAKLIDVKSIMTILVIIGLIFFTRGGIIKGDNYYQIVMIIVTFYFGTQTGKALVTNDNTAAKTEVKVVEVPQVEKTTTPAESAAYTGAKDDTATD